MDRAPDLLHLQVEQLDDTELDHLVQVLTDEQRRRAVSAGDLPAVADEAFEQLFDAKGAAIEPRVAGRLLVCPGSVVPKTKTVHSSRFVAVGETWVWDTMDLLHDEVRRGEGPAMRSVSIVPLVEGLEYHVVWSKGPTGGRRLEQATSYRVRGGVPEPVSTRVPKLVANR